MKNHKKKYLLIYISLTLLIISCNTEKDQVDSFPILLPSNTLNYIGTPTSPKYRNSLMFSDQGAWFAYGFSVKKI